MPAKLTPQEALRRAAAQVVSSWTPGIKPRWTIAEVRNALRLHAQGNFSESAMLVDAMGEDDAIPVLLEKRVDAVLKEDFVLNPVEKPNKSLSKRIAAELEPLWCDMYPEAELDELVRWYRMLGVGLAVFDWDRSSVPWKPRLRTLHPQYLYWDDWNEKWFYNAREGLLEVTPGDGTWVLLTDGQRGWMRGLVRSCAIPWIGKQLTIRDQGRYNERHGFPLLKAFVPMIADEGDRDQYWEDLKGLANESTVELLTHVDGQSKDASYDLELLEAKDTSHKGFENTLQRWDLRLTILFLGGNQSTEVSGNVGTNASATQHADELVDKAQADEKRLSTQLRKQGLWPTVAYNYAGATYEITPWPHWDVDPPEDTKREAEDQESFGKALKAMQDAGFDVANVDELAEKHGLKVVKRKEPEPVVPPGTPPGEEPDDEDDSDDEEDDDEPDAENLSAVAASGYDNGRQYADRVHSRLKKRAAKELMTTIAAMVAECAKATDYRDAMRRITERYGRLAPPTKLAEYIDAAMTMAQLGGTLGVREDVEELKADGVESHGGASTV